LKIENAPTKQVQSRDIMNQLGETYISVDVETAGPNPSLYSLLTIGACTIEERPRTFYVEVKPVNDKITPESFAIHRLDLKRLAERGVQPAIAMANFETWLKTEVPPDQTPVFVAFNAPFDWMFVNDYFHRFLKRNPFGHSAIDIKAFYMGLTGSPWSETSMRSIGPRYLRDQQLTHHALRDAVDQGEIFRKMLSEARSRTQIHHNNNTERKDHEQQP
jgi:DNA polymerase III epsilon subunit-like protein